MSAAPDPADLPLPPGRAGLPLLGELPKLARDAYGFVEDGARRYGPIFRTRVLRQPTVVITGPDANGKFIDETDVQRSHAMPPHVEALFGGRDLLPLLDGPAHHLRKHFVMAAFTREALAAYLPTLEGLVRASIDRWAQAGEQRWLEPLKRLAVEGICTTVIGLPPGPVVDRLIAEYDRVTAGFTALPLPLPGSTYRRARRALDRIVAIYADTVRDRMERPREDGLSRMLAARGPDGERLSVDHAARELHHVVIAGLIVWAWFMAAGLELDRHPELRTQLRAELDAAAGTPLSLEKLDALPLLGRVTMEVQRLSPVVQVFFGKARRTFAFAGHRVPAGWMVLWGIRSSHIRPELYPDPLRFDPDRFLPARAEHQRHPLAFVPNGAGDPHQGHKCAGYQFAPYFLRLFLHQLVRTADWRFAPGQDLNLNWSQVPPGPRDGARVVITPRG